MLSVPVSREVCSFALISFFCVVKYNLFLQFPRNHHWNLTTPILRKFRAALINSLSLYLFLSSWNISDCKVSVKLTFHIYVRINFWDIDCYFSFRFSLVTLQFFHYMFLSFRYVRYCTLNSLGTYALHWVLNVR